MNRALLVTDKDVTDLVLLEYLVIDRQDGAAGITEYGIDTLILQSLDHHPRARHLLRHAILMRKAVAEPPTLRRRNLCAAPQRVNAS